MKRNIFPLLGIAFVVAIAATGVFYGLFVGKISGASTAAAASHAGVVVTAKAVDRGSVLSASDVRLAPSGASRPDGSFGSVESVVGRTVSKPLAANEPVTATGLILPKGGGELTIPKGMRAISVRVAESVGLLPYLRGGHHVDVQAIQLHNNEVSVRTLLSDVEVLNVHIDPNPHQTPATVLNLLVPTRDVERVALADSAWKLRIVLRNAEEKEGSQVSPATGTGRAATTSVASASRDSGPRVSFEVRMATATSATVREIAQRAGTTSEDQAFRIGLLPADWKADAALPQLERKKALRVLSTESLDSAQGQEVSVQAGGAKQREYELRLGLMTRGMASGTVRLRVRPELTVSQRGGVSSRRFSADLNVADGQSVLVAGFERDPAAVSLVEKLFQAAAPQPGSELIMVVTPRMIAAAR